MQHDRFVEVDALGVDDPPQARAAWRRQGAAETTGDGRGLAAGQTNDPHRTAAAGGGDGGDGVGADHGVISA